MTLPTSPAQPIKIYIWGGTEKIESFSPFCMKAIYGARLKGLAPTLKFVSLKMPKWAKGDALPVAEIQFGNETFNVEDSSAILRKLDLLYPLQNKLYPLDETLRCEVRLLEDWADEYLFSFGLTYRWANDKNFSIFSKDAFGKLPWIFHKLILPKIRKDTVGTLASRTVKMASEADRKLLFNDAMRIVHNRLTKNQFLVGNQITAADLAVYSLLEQAVSVSQIEEILPIVEQYPLITQWMERVKTKVAPVKRFIIKPKN